MSTLREKPAEYKGHVSNGVIVLDSPAALPEGAAVRVRPVGRRRARPARGRSDTDPAWDEIAKLAGTIEGPEDWAAEHDHYIHGTPKRGGGKA